MFYGGPTWLKGYEVLDQRFAQGWLKLPDEVKVMILSKDPKLNGDLKRRDVRHGPGQRAGLKKLLKYQKMMYGFGSSTETPDTLSNGASIGELATQLYYETHHFHIEGALTTCSPHVTESSSSPTVLVPRPGVNRWIKNLSIRVALDTPGWCRLRRLANGEWGFDGLEHLRVEVHETMHRGCFEFDSDDQIMADLNYNLNVVDVEPIIFKSSGTFVYTLVAAGTVDPLYNDSRRKTFVRLMQDVLQEKIVFQPKSKHDG